MARNPPYERFQRKTEPTTRKKKEPTISSILKHGLDDKTVEDFIYGNTGSMSPAGSSKEPERPSQLYSPRDDEFLEIPSSAGLPPGVDWRQEGLFHDQESYSSFGEKGTTASVNSYGNLMHISRYLGVGTSGIFCAYPSGYKRDSPHGRMGQLLDLSTNAHGGFGLCLKPELASHKPRLQFLHDRWPRYTYNVGGFSVSIQYFANRGTVIQQYLFQRTQEHEARNGTESSDVHTLRRANDDVNQNVHDDPAVRTQAEAAQVQNKKKPSTEDCTEKGQTKRSLPHNDKTSYNSQDKLSVKNYLRFNLMPLQIQEPEATTSSGHFDQGHRAENSTYYYTLGQNRYSSVVYQQVPDTGKAVRLVVAVFVNGRATKMRLPPKLGLYSGDIRAFVEDQELKTNTSLEITVAYKLRLMAKGYSWKSTLIPISVLDLKDLIAQSSYDRKLSMSTSRHLNFIIKRNLEHILSVCSIPVSDTPILDDGSTEDTVSERSTGISQAGAKGSEWGNAIALTCGDISGHHVLVSASFFAFQFLVAIHNDLSRPSRLKARIFETLRGHMEWTFLHIKRHPDNSSRFLAGYWASGQEVTFLRGHTNPQHTSLQIINAKDFAEISRSDKQTPSWFLTKMDDFIGNWISSLRESDSRDYCMFPRESYRDEKEGYYLRDHVLIWKALGITEELKKFRAPDASVPGPTDPKEKERRQLSLGVYTPDQARRSILKRFTTRNTMTNERMLAIYRDAQDSSFLLDTSDTILFYDEHRFFRAAPGEASNSQLQDGSKDILDEWIRTLNVQPRHKENSHEAWQEPLQYALVIQMAGHGHQIDSRPANEIFDGALKVLLQSCSVSGIFPGFLPREAKLSANFDGGFRTSWRARDSYWHTSFELPYILWMHAKVRLEETSGQDRNQSPPGSPPDATQGKINRETQSPMSQSTDDQKPMPKFLSTKTVLGDQDFTDQKNVFEILDEWLVPCPEFLHFNPKRPLTDVLEASTQQGMSIAKLRRLVIDIPKRRDHTDDQTLVDPQPSTSGEFFERLRQWRTKKANMLVKKRIVWISSGDKETAAICSATVPESEQLALTDFFGKHNNWDKSFLDHPSASKNCWKTEFQISFYQLGSDTGKEGAQSKPEISLAKRIRRGSMGFRFNGDFFDRYWTCHVMTSSDRKSKGKGHQIAEVDRSTQEVETLLNNCLSKKIGDPELAVTDSWIKKYAWHQRKVLELVLFEEIVREVRAGTQDILEEINKVLASATQSGLEDSEAIQDLPDKIKETVLFSKIDSSAYFSFSSQWEVLQQLLQVLNEDLSDTFKRISSWQSREDSRGKEIPRWTGKDEKRYRAAVRTMQISNSESVRELQQLQERAQAFRFYLINRRDYIRDDLNLRGAENTRYFTYVTVVFLPLGFATGIFSMSETPAGSTLARMSGTAATTFLLTVIALYSIADVLEAIKKPKKILAKQFGRFKANLGQVFQRGSKELNRRLQPVERALESLFPPVFIIYVLLRALGESMANLFKRLWAISTRSLKRVKEELERLLLPLVFAYVLWSILAGSMNNFLNSQALPSPRSPNERDTDFGNSTSDPPDGSTQGQPLRQTRSASRSGDLENQVRSGHSFR